MKLLSVSPEQTGFIAVGQLARGFFAFGQMATGIVAVGQVARGVIVLGQGAVGLFAIGQGALGVFQSTAMLPIGGTLFFHFPLLVMNFPRRQLLPQTTSLHQITKADWILASLNDTEHGPVLTDGDTPLPVKFPAQFLPAIARYHTEASQGKWNRDVYVFVKKNPYAYVVSEIQVVAEMPWRKAGFVSRTLLQFIGLTIVATAWWLLAGYESLAIVRQYMSGP